MAALPYITSPGNITKALSAILTAATPESVSQDFVKTVLKIPGGSGTQITSLLKKIGFANQDGKPTKRYTAFRNSATSGEALAEAVRDAYAPLFIRNEYAYRLDDAALLGLVIEETGAGEESSVPKLVVSCLKALKEGATFENGKSKNIDEVTASPQLLSVNALPPIPPSDKSVGLSLSYTINLNLPATTDITVFNAIFKSLKENMLEAA